jgi:pimeloyl-ACP methyl ester carboxylesterase
MRGEFIDLAGERLYYYAAGSRGSGEPIVLVHGFPTSSHLWLDVVAKLPPGHRVVVLDLLGFGRSDAPAAAHYTIAAHGRRLLLLLDALKIDRTCLAGHGIGGSIALWVALNEPARVSRLALIGSGDAFGGALGLMLRLPGWASLPLVRRAIARGYADRERGHRSAELYLKPFSDAEGVEILRRHVAQLSDGESSRFAARIGEAGVPALSWSGRSAFEPEEAPSDVAAKIAELLRRT